MLDADPEPAGRYREASPLQESVVERPRDELSAFFDEARAGASRRPTPPRNVRPLRLFPWEPARRAGRAAPPGRGGPPGGGDRFLGGLDGR